MKNKILKKLLIAFYLSIFVIATLSFAWSFDLKRIFDPFETRFTKEEVEALGVYERFKLPKGMISKHQNKLKIAAQEVLHRFVKKKLTLPQFPGKAIKAMAFFEILFNELLRDPAFETKLLVDINKGRNSFRQAFGFFKTLSTEDATYRYWTLGELLDQGQVEKVIVPDDLIQRKVLLRDLKNRIGALRSKIEFDTSFVSSVKKIDVVPSDTDTDLEDGRYKGYCLRENGTVYKTIYENNCVNNKEISYEEYLNIVDSGSILSSDPSSEWITTKPATKLSDKDQGIEERLRKVKSFYEKGLITKEEYDDKRKEILDAY